MSINHDDLEKKLQLIALAKEAIEKDNLLREKYQIGDKFRFVRDRLHGLLEQLEKHIPITTEEKKTEPSLADEDTLVFVYLYNSHGANLQTWVNMLTPKLFYEYSINRPIYNNKAHVELLIRSKSNKSQHAFLTIAVNKNAFILGDESPKDALGNQIIKVKEGALHFNKLLSFTHNGQVYILNENRILIKKPQ